MMGMFDSYYISGSFRCPNCGTMFDNVRNDFQSKDGDCTCAAYKLGSKMDVSRRWWDFYGWCSGSCKGGDYNCRVYINDEGIAYREEVTMYDEKPDKTIVVYKREIREC